MKHNTLAVILVFTLFLSSVAKASTGAGDAAAGIVTAIGVGAALSATTASGLYPGESEYWLDPELKSTSKLSEQCGLILETKIFQNGPWALVWVAGRNISGRDVQVRNHFATINYSNSIMRYFDLDMHPESFVPDGMYYHQSYKIHQRSDFKNAESMELMVPTDSAGKRCEIKVIYRKNPNYKEDEVYYTETFSTGLHIGPSYLSGSLKDLSDDGIGLGLRLDLSAFGNSRHGLYLDMGLSSVNESNSVNTANPTVDGDTLNHTSIGFGYQYRTIIDDQSSIYYRVGPAFGSFRYGKSTSASTISSSYVGANLSIRYNGQFANIERGAWFGRYFYSIGLTSDIVPKISFNNSDYSGTSTSLVFGLSVGL